MPKHKWTFKSRFRSGAYSWRGTQLASKRMREAVSKIKNVAKAGGSPGALLGQILISHKSKKWNFNAIFILTMILHVGGVVVYIKEVKL